MPSKASGNSSHIHQTDRLPPNKGTNTSTRDESFNLKSDISTCDLKDEFEHVLKPRRYFRLGRVFAVYWIEPGSSNKSAQTVSLSPHLETRIFSEVRRFIVVHESLHASLCVPIHTYGGKGVEKHDIRLADHARVYPSGDSLPAVEKDVRLREPIEITLESKSSLPQLHPASVADFGRIYTIEHYMKVKNIGFVHRRHNHRLRLHWTIPPSIEPTKVGSVDSCGKMDPSLERGRDCPPSRAIEQWDETMAETSCSRLSEDPEMKVEEEGDRESQLQDDPEMKGEAEEDRDNQLQDNPELKVKEQGRLSPPQANTRQRLEEDQDNPPQAEPESNSDEGWEIVTCEDATNIKAKLPNNKRGSGIQDEQIVGKHSPNFWERIKGPERTRSKEMNIESYTCKDSGFEIVEVSEAATPGMDTQDSEWFLNLRTEVSCGNTETVQNLLNNGNGLKIPACQYGALLQNASSQRNRDIVEHLLRCRAMNKLISRHGRVPRPALAEHHKEVVQLLLDVGVEAIMWSTGPGTAVQNAFSQGYERLMQLLEDTKNQLLFHKRPRVYNAGGTGGYVS